MPAENQPDPQRPFILALRSVRIMGFLSTALGLSIMIADGFLNRLPQFRLAFKLLSAIIWILPGIAFVVAAILMPRRQRWAAILAIIAAALQLLMAATGLFANAFVFGPISLIPFIMCILWIAALAQMIIHLRQSLPIIPTIQGNEPRGFELIPNEPLAAIPMDQSSLNNLPNQS